LKVLQGPERCVCLQTPASIVGEALQRRAFYSGDAFASYLT
jgi:hypothetical protein